MCLASVSVPMCVCIRHARERKGVSLSLRTKIVLSLEC